VRLLFVKEHLAWPRSSGHDVHCYHLMRGLADLGHTIALVTKSQPAEPALAGAALHSRWTFTSAPPPGPEVSLSLSWLQEKFRSYWGIEEQAIRTVGGLAQSFRADAVIVVGLNVLPYLGAVQQARRIWYAADEWVWHHLSLMQWWQPSTWAELRPALIKGMYEWAYGSLLDRIWVVSEADARAMRWVVGNRAIDVIANGVDGDHYRPLAIDPEPDTCTFWGRLDFEPNIQALQWFCRRIWPTLRRLRPQARFTIYGFQPTPTVLALANCDGVQLIADLPDLRQEIARHAVVVLPFVSGGGIKNKLLEAASMGRPIVCSRRAAEGLRYLNQPPFRIAHNPNDWVANLLQLWDDKAQRNDLGTTARNWVLQQHTWEAAAQLAAAGLERSLQEPSP
jgi:glycosyltransferase involved in cell wall biosynthesis